MAVPPAKGYEIVYSLEEARKTTGDKLGALIAEDAVEPASRRDPDLLADATQLAIDKLSSNKKGFVLMVEGSQIDKGGHKNDQNYMISETLDFDRAVGKALDFAQKDKNTLVLITADHETGGVTVAEGHYGKKKVVVKFNTGWHTASPVPFFAYGPGAELFSGFKDNTAPFT
jgi:alkaline phosphatase